jgi:uncharacterized RDD family membrane protein YckC
MYCTHCGTQVEGPFCTICGTPLNVNAPSDRGPIPQYSGWWRRVGATLIDELILVLPTIFVSAVVAAIAGTLAGELLGLAVGGVYMVTLLSRPAGQTIGNQAVSTYVRDAVTGLPISTTQALKRWGFIAAYGLIDLLVSPNSLTIVGVIGLVDFLYPLFNARKQTLHDLFAGTVVYLK